MTRREREERAEAEFIGKHYKSEFDEPDEDTAMAKGTELRIPSNESDLEKIGTDYQGDIQRLKGYSDHLREMPLGRLKAATAKEYFSEAKHFLDTIENSHATAITKFLHRMHKLAVGTVQKVQRPAQDLIAECQRIQVDYARELQKKADEERRKREQAAREEQERLRKEQVEHLRAMEKEEAAKQLELAPLPPVALPEPAKAVGKIEGVAMIQTWTIDENDPFDDPAAFWKWFSENPSAWGMVSLKAGDWKRFLTSNKGTMRPPGMKVVEKTETRTRAD